MLDPLGANIWLADGGIVDFYGFAYPTRMAIIRLDIGDLWIWSPVALTEELAGAVNALGPVKHLVSPNKIHHLFLSEWQAAYPEAQLWGPESTVTKREDLTFAGSLTDDAPPAWQGQIDQYLFTNSKFLEEVAFFHRASSTVIFADLSENFSAAFLEKHWSWWQRPIARLWSIVEGKGYAPLELRATFRNRQTARAKLHDLIAADPRRVVMAHGEIAREDGADYLRQAFAWLL
ncbi:DUF4336 domain-containing protein [Parasphingopyxis sp. CP4]|uniref:DUF4336 domain-containing protein n=1 Tax=Parasphingopyxis sp. CP4 TaxID=2724527 RepID=UPI0015A12206|nr:DUF4336 domain-containing protein [Parasphingopyxis sp. CP4]QLC23283.1 DUF4336 domain-containing protein [Parasphingopyxis sp. CP4]